MKKFLLVAVAFGIILSLGVLGVLANSIFNTKGLKGSGNLITKTMDAPAFEGVKASRAVKVIITDKTDRISIQADDNLIEHVVVRLDEEDLLVSIDNKLKSITNHHVTVTVPANGRIASLKASSAAEIRSEVELSSDKFEIDASSAAKITAAVKAPKCEIDASSASTINATVTATECEAEASSASKIDLAVQAASCSLDTSSAAKIQARGAATACQTASSSGSKISAGKLITETCNAQASSGSNTRVNCTKQLKARASSGASIVYTGNCTTDISKSSGGSVRED